MGRFTVIHFRKPAGSTNQASPTMCFDAKNNTSSGTEDDDSPSRPRSPTWVNRHLGSRSYHPIQPSSMAVQTPLHPAPTPALQQIQPQSSAPALQKPAISPRQQVLLDALAGIRARLEALRPDLEARKEVLTLLIKHSYFLANPKTVQWHHRVISDQATFDAIEREIKLIDRKTQALADKGIAGIGSKLKMHTLTDWEMRLENLRWSNMSYYERHEWYTFEEYVEARGKAFEVGWSWEKVTAKQGPGLEEQVDPTDASKMNLEQGAGDPMYTQAYCRKAGS